MKFVVAPNALKGSLSAPDAARALASGLRRARPEAELHELPLADGGDGTCAVLVRALGGERREVAARDALLRPLRASFGWLEREKTAVLDVASASGLVLLAADELDPLRASSFGTGELLAAALALGARRVLLGVGGSATVDAGIGLLSALGARFLDASGASLEPCGAALGAVASVELSGVTPAARRCEIVVLCDVQNPLSGPDGAAWTFAAQKGATVAQQAELDAALGRFGALLQRVSGRDVAALAGAGAAGGIPATLGALLGARLERGSDFILDLLDFERVISGAELVLTAEGRLDRQSAANKAPYAVARRALSRGVPTLALAGAISEDFDVAASPFCAALAFQRGPSSLADSRRDAAALLSATGEQALRLFLAGRKAVQS